MSKLIDKTTIYKSRATWQRLDVLAVIGNCYRYDIDPTTYVRVLLIISAFVYSISASVYIT